MYPSKINGYRDFENDNRKNEEKRAKKGGSSENRVYSPVISIAAEDRV